MGYYNGSRCTGSGGTWVQGVEHRVCDIQRVPPPARCTIDRQGGGGGGRGVAKNARNVFTPTAGAILLPLYYTTSYHYHYYHAATTTCILYHYRYCRDAAAAAAVCVPCRFAYAGKLSSSTVVIVVIVVIVSVASHLKFPLSSLYRHAREDVIFSTYIYIFVCIYIYIYIFVKQYYNKISYGLYDRRCKYRQSPRRKLFISCCKSYDST